MISYPVVWLAYDVLSDTKLNLIFNIKFSTFNAHSNEISLGRIKTAKKRKNANTDKNFQTNPQKYFIMLHDFALQ